MNKNKEKKLNELTKKVERLNFIHAELCEFGLLEEIKNVHILILKTQEKIRELKG